METDCQASPVSRLAPFTSWITDWVSSLSQSDIVFFLTSNSGRSVVIQQRYWQLCLLAYWQWWQNELCLLTDNGDRMSCACLLTMVTERAVHAYWQWWQNELCLLTDNGGRTSCACLLTMVTERAVHAYWQWWQNELCMLADNGDRKSCACLLTVVAERAVHAYWQWWQNERACLLTMVAEYHLVLLVLLIRTLDNPSLKPGPANTAHLSNLFHGFTQCLLGKRGIVPCCDVLSNSHKSCLDAI